MESLFVLPANPPSVGNNAFKYVSKEIPVYVYDVSEYEKGPWGEFTNFKGLDDDKQVTFDDINNALQGESSSA